MVIRATGDGWEAEGHFDPDYDSNSEILFLMLNDVGQVSQDLLAAGYEDNFGDDESESLHSSILVSLVSNISC